MARVAFGSAKEATHPLLHSFCGAEEAADIDSLLGLGWAVLEKEREGEGAGPGQRLESHQLHPVFKEGMERQLIEALANARS